MILVDTSVWVDHLRATDRQLAAQLEAGHVLAHPFVIGEIALGSLRNRDTVLDLLLRLPHATAATDHEVLRYIDDARLFGLGIGYVDAHLVASVLLTPGAGLWTRDKRLQGAAARMGIAMPAGGR